MNAHQKILFLDFDGVLHPPEVYLRNGEPWLDSEDLNLFCWAHLLEATLLIYPELKIVISSSWSKIFGIEVLKQKLPTSLAERVIDTTRLYQINKHARGLEILFYATDHNITNWIALDDDGFEWPASELDKFIRCNPDRGVSSPLIIKKLSEKLAAL